MYLLLITYVNKERKEVFSKHYMYYDEEYIVKQACELKDRIISLGYTITLLKVYKVEKEIQFPEMV